jgi:integrase
VATTEQIWALHEAMPDHLRITILLGAFAGLRVAEVCGLRIRDIDFMRGVISPEVQYGGENLKSETSQTLIPIPAAFALGLSAHVAEHSGGETLLSNAWGQPLSPRTLERHFRKAREGVPGLAFGFRFQDLRHYLASMLIASGSDVKAVQTRLRHASAKTTLDTYAHLWPDSDNSTRDAVAAVLDARADSLRTVDSLPLQKPRSQTHGN